jgi:hypothetical protein
MFKYCISKRERHYSQSKIHSNYSSLGILTHERPFMERYGMALARTLVDAANEIVYARVFNPGTSDVTVYKHAHIALFTPVCPCQPRPVGQNTPDSHLKIA